MSDDLRFLLSMHKHMQNFSSIEQIIFRLHLKKYRQWSLGDNQTIEKRSAASNFSFAIIDILRKKSQPTFLS